MGTLDEGKRWQTVLAENPGAIDGRYNRNRRALLEPGVYLDLSLETAKSWFHDIRDEIAPDVSVVSDTNDAVRVTVMELLDEGSAVRDLRVQVNGRAQMMSSTVFYNSIFKHHVVESFFGGGDLISGVGVPTRGETSHANYAHRSS